MTPRYFTTWSNYVFGVEYYDWKHSWQNLHTVHIIYLAGFFFVFLSPVIEEESLLLHTHAYPVQQSDIFCLHHHALTPVLSQCHGQGQEKEPNIHVFDGKGNQSTQRKPTQTCKVHTERPSFILVPPWSFFLFVFMKQLLYELLQNFVHTLIFSLDELL